MSKKVREKREARAEQESRRRQIVRSVQNICAAEQKRVKALVTFGTEILNGSETVLVKLGNGDFRKCAATELREGQEVVFSKSGLNLEDIRAGLEKVISQGPIYRHLLGSLFTNLDDGTPITTFSRLLLAGIVEAPHMWPSEFRKYRSITEVLDPNHGINSCHENAHLAADTIRGKLVLAQEKDNRLVAPTEDQIRRRWVGGEVILPKNYHAIIPILTEIAPGLIQLLSPQFEREYNKYRALRLSISVRLTNTILGKKQKDTTEGRQLRATSSNLESIDVDEIKRVVEHFGDSLTPNYATAPILKIEVLSEDEAIKSAQKSRIISELPADLEGRLIDANEIAKRALVLDFILNNEMRLPLELTRENMINPFNNAHFLDRMFSHFGYGGFLQTHNQILASLTSLGYKSVAEHKPVIDSLMSLADTYFEIIIGKREGTIINAIGFEGDELAAFFSNYAKYKSNVEYHIVYYSILQGLATAYYNKKDTRGLDIQKLTIEYAALREVLAKKGVAEFLLSRAHLITIMRSPNIQTAYGVAGITKADILRWTHRFDVMNDRAFSKLSFYQEPNYWKGKTIITDDEALRLLRRIKVFDTISKIWKYNDRIIKKAEAELKREKA